MGEAAGLPALNWAIIDILLSDMDLISPVSPSYTNIVSSIIAIPSGELSPDTSVSVSPVDETSIISPLFRSETKSPFLYGITCVGESN